MKKALIAACLFSVFMSITIHCSDSATPRFQVKDHRPRITVTDNMGRERIIPRPLKRVVVLGGTAAEIIWSLDEGDAVIARSEWTVWPPPMKELPSIGYPDYPNLELLWHLKPDVIIADTHFWAATDRVEKLGFPILFFNGYTLTELPEAILGIGKVFGCEKRARNLLEDWQAIMDLTAKRLADLTEQERPTAFQGNGEHLYFTSNIKSGKRMLIDAGAINAADSLPLPWQFVSAEWLVMQDPDYFVFGADLSPVNFEVAGLELMSRLHKTASRRPGLRHLEAVKGNRVQIMNRRLTYGLRSAIGTVYLAKIFHPDRLADIDPLEIHQNFLKEYFDMNLDGVYIYP